MKGKRLRASLHNERGLNLNTQGRTGEAIREYEIACELAPEWSVPFYNLGLVHKYSGDWARSLLFNQRAVERDSSDEASWWNLGIAATALGDWQEARRAWRGCGMDVPAGDGPVDYPSGTSPIRLNPDGEPEVVWSQRLDPARALLRSIPFSNSGFRWGDVVINDGAPTGYRKFGDGEVPVFDCLGLLQASEFSTFVAEVEMAGEPADLDLLAQMADNKGAAAEDWTTSVRTLCRACSEGTPHEQHDQALDRVEGLHRIAVATRTLAEAEGLLSHWREQVLSAHILSLEVALEA